VLSFFASATSFSPIPWSAAVYLFAEAQWQYSFGWLDLLWTIPRIIMIWGAVTWIDLPYTSAEIPPCANWTFGPGFPLHLASMLGPLMVAMVALPISPICTHDGRCSHPVVVRPKRLSVSLTRDLKKATAQELQSNRHLLEALVEGTTEAIYIRDLDGRYMLAIPPLVAC